VSVLASRAPGIIKRLDGVVSEAERERGGIDAMFIGTDRTFRSAERVVHY
jgi:hypothetical protein